MAVLGAIRVRAERIAFEVVMLAEEVSFALSARYSEVVARRCSGCD